MRPSLFMLNTAIYYVGGLEAPDVRSYTRLDVG